TISDKKDDQSVITLPEWAKTSATAEGLRTALPRSVASKATESNAATERGEAVHKLLEVLPSIDETKWQDVGQQILTSHAPDLEDT
ncbi:hypothetical protein GN156_32785, partial [bacterium LRH843]|nr:hypothetical protein [bacterium LRH843]